MEKVFLSIITINLNNIIGLQKTLESVVAQTWVEYEHIVVDGGSLDRSIELLQGFNYPLLTFVSEPDRGIYHAMNKGIEMAKGNYLLFLNSGDYLHNGDVLQRCIEQMDTNSDIVYGDIYIRQNNGSLLQTNYPVELSFRYFYNGNSLPHPASIIRKTLFSRVGKYNENYQIVSDWEFWLKAIFVARASYSKVPLVITVFNSDGISSQQKSKKIIFQERRHSIQKHFSFYKVLEAKFINGVLIFLNYLGTCKRLIFK